MIRISWEEETESWYHHEDGEMFFWGADRMPLPYSPSKSSDLNHKLKKIENAKAGPIIGILTSTDKKLPFVGNIDTFIRLIRYVQEQGGLAIVFTSRGVSSSSLHGYTYDLLKYKWKHVRVPFPDFVYNRIPYREDEKSSDFIDVMKWLNAIKIPYFNHRFFTKWETYLILNDNPGLQLYLPETKLICSKRQVEDFLSVHGQILIKPDGRSQGKGVFSLKLNPDGSLFFTSNEGSLYTHLDVVWGKTIHRQKRLIMQPMINRKKIHSRPFDYRILIQKTGPHWNVTGYGLRCAGADRLTTHVPAGGKLLSAEEAPLDIEVIRKIAYEIGVSLDEAIGPVCEFSIDLGVDCNEHYWIFEVNSKPMVFDEPEIQYESLKRWYQHILTVTGFPDIKDPTLTHTIEKGG